MLSSALVLAAAIFSPAAQTSSTATTATHSAARTVQGAEASQGTPAEKAAVAYHNETILYLAPTQGTDQIDRARKASRALAGALEAKDPAITGAHPAEVRSISSSTVALYVRGYLVTEIGEADARAAGYPSVQAYARDLDDGVGLYVADQLRRRALQGFALRTLLAVLILIAGLISIRTLGRLFDRADDFIYERRKELKPFTVLRVPIVSQETLGAAVTFAIAIGRVVIYVAAIIATASLVLAQFDATRTWVGRALAWGTAPMVAAVEGLVGALPGLALAAALFLGLKTIIRVIGLLLDSVAEGHQALRDVTPERVRVLRVLLPIAAVIVVSPLMIAAAFGSFHTPLELIAIAGAAAGALAFVPLFAAAIVGFHVLWRHAIRVGDWLEVGGVSGKVVDVSPWEIVFDRGRDVRVAVPMLSVLFKPVRKSAAVPKHGIEIFATNDRPIREIVGAVERAMHAVDGNAELSCLGFTPESVELRVETGSANAEIRQAIVLALASATEVKVTSARLL
jgi:small-conductance mechanosensitive channel